MPDLAPPETAHRRRGRKAAAAGRMVAVSISLSPRAKKNLDAASEGTAIPRSRIISLILEGDKMEAAQRFFR